MSLDTSSVKIPVEDVAILFQCGKCQVAPFKPPVYKCRNGHLTCSDCHQGIGTECHKCNDSHLSRNLVLEKVMRGLKSESCAALSEFRALPKQSLSEQSLNITVQDSSHLENEDQARLKAEQEEQMSHSHDFTTESSTSRALLGENQTYRPVGCPYPCGRFISCSSLFPHFEFQHPRVTIATVNKETATHIHINYDEAILEECKCLAFHILRLDDNDASKPDYSSWSSADLLRISKSSLEMLHNGCFISILCVGRLTSILEDDEAEPEAFLVAWCTSLYEFPPVSYTLRASNANSSHCFSYTGPLSSMQQSQIPNDVYDRGDCFLIPPGLQKELSNESDSTMKFTITFHVSPYKLPVLDSVDFHILDKNLLIV